MTFRSVRAVAPTTGRLRYVIVDSDLELQWDATSFLTWMTNARSASINSTRAYGARVALFLSWAESRGVEWRTVSLTELAWYKRWLEDTPPSDAPPSRRTGLERLRTGKTVNAHITAVSEFIRFGAREGFIAARVADRLTQPKYLSKTSRGFDVGEDGQFRHVRARLLVSPETERALELLADDEVDSLVSAASNARDRFLIYGLRATGLRIGEQLGLRREDMHLLPSSRHLGCQFGGAHIHVVRRTDNDNGALAKSHTPRVVPVDSDYASLYRDYVVEREREPAAVDQDMLFVNLFHAPLGRGMSYRATMAQFERLSARLGFTARPHMLRHAFASSLTAQGVHVDVVRELLGHASLQSTGIYLHPQEEAMREAISRASAYRIGKAT